MSDLTIKKELETNGYQFNYDAYGIAVTLGDTIIYRKQCDPYTAANFIGYHNADEMADHYLGKGIEAAQKHEQSEVNNER